MARSWQITSTPVHLPCIVAIVGPVEGSLFARCISAASRSNVMLHHAGVVDAANLVTEKRPFAIVMTNAIHALDPNEFDALACDVQAVLLKVDEEVTERELEAMLAGVFREKERQQMTGRYSIIRGTPTQPPPPLSSRSRPTPAADTEPLSSRMKPPRSSRTRSTPASSPPSSRRLQQGDEPRSSRGRTTQPPPTDPLLAAQRRSTPPRQPVSCPAPPPPSQPLTARSSLLMQPHGQRMSLKPANPSLQGQLAPPSSRQIAGPAPVDDESASTRPTPLLPGPPETPSLMPNTNALLARLGQPPVPETLRPPVDVRSNNMPADPRSGVRERSIDELDAVFEEQPLQLEALPPSRRTFSWRR